MSQKLQKLTEALRPGANAPSLAAPRELTLPYYRALQEESESAGAFSLHSYWRTIHARRRTIFWAVAFALAAAAVYNFVRVPTYRATATIQIDREGRDIAHLDDDYARPLEQPDYIETQYKVLRSRSLARRVIGKLGLQDRKEFQGRTLEEDAGAVTEGEQDFAASALVGTIPPASVDIFLDRLGVSPGKGTRLVDVSFESVDRRLSPLIVNTLAGEYIEHNLETKWNATQKASSWLEQQLSQLKAKLEASETTLQSYAARHSILFVEDRKDITTEKLAQLEDELTRAEADRIRKQSGTILIAGLLEHSSALPASLSSETYQNYQAALAELRGEYSRLLVTFAPGYPKVERVQRQMDEMGRAIREEKERILDSVREKYQLALNREELLRAAARNQRRLVYRISDDFIEYNILKRDAETNRELYEGLLQRLKEAGISAGLRASNISVLDPAELPRQSYRPKKLLNFLLALAGGLMLGAGLAFAQEHLNTLVRTPEEVEQLTGLSLLAVIPRGKEMRHGKIVMKPSRPADHSAETTPGSSADGGDGGGQTLAAGEARWAPEAGLSEAYRTLRSSVLLGSDESMRRLLVTSSQPEEGKTSVTLHLACSLAQLDRRVLVIDGDMRRPNCDKRLGVSNDQGLADFLQGLAQFDDVVTPTPIPGLSLIPAGRTSATASDLLYSPRLAALLEEAGQRFDHVVIDSPPSLVLSDARTISRLVEGVILVVSDETERGSLLRTKQTFDEAQVRFLGFVMNRVDLDNLDYGYYKNYGYYYAYSSQEATRQ